MISHIHSPNLYSSNASYFTQFSRHVWSPYVGLGPKSSTIAVEAKRSIGALESERYTTIGGITYKVANRRHEREQAFGLVYQSYVESGLMEPNPFRMRVTPFHLLPTTDVFIAKHEDQVICTLSLVSDETTGVLPMDVIYKQETDELRKGGASLAEISCLARKIDYFDRSRMFDVLVRLISLVGQSARFNGVSQMLLAIHPRHFRFYRKCFGCTQFGDERTYSSVRGQPAVACVHDFARLDSEKYMLYKRSYDHLFEPREMSHQPMLESDVSHFSRVATFCTTYAPMAA